jgi:hypothetical protein
MTEDPEQSGQRAAELHHFFGEFGYRVLIDAIPGVVDEHSGSSVDLILDSHGRQTEVPIR